MVHFVAARHLRNYLPQRQESARNASGKWLEFSLAKLGRMGEITLERAVPRAPPRARRSASARATGFEKYISLLLIVAGIALWIWFRRQPPPYARPVPPAV